MFKLGIDCKLLRIVKNMYSQVKSCVRGCKLYSEFFECAIGLKQGKVLSPVMFSLFIENLELFCKMYQIVV